VINQQKVCNLTGLVSILGALLFSWVDLNKSLVEVNTTQTHTTTILNERRNIYEAALLKYDEQFKELYEKVNALTIKIIKLEENGNG